MTPTTTISDTHQGLSGAPLVRLVALCALAITFDGYDLVVYGATVSGVMDEWGIAPDQAGVVGSYALVGMMLGALLVGSLADRIGRRRVLIASIIWFSGWMIVSAVAPSLWVFALSRFLCGLGLGGCMPSATAMVVEYAPKARGNLTYVIMQSGFAVGGILAAGLALIMLPSLGWRSMYLFGGVAPILLVVLPALRHLPESLEFLVTRGRMAEAEQLAKRLRLPQPTPANESAPRTSPLELTRNGLLPGTLLFWVATFSALLLVYGLNTWLPEIMRTQGYPLGSALTFLLVFNLGSIVGSVIGGWVADRIGSKPVIVASFTLAAISAMALSLRPDVWLLYALVAIGGHGAIGTQNLINPFVTSYYPARLRSTGIGWSLGIGRLGAITGPIIGGAVLASTLSPGWNFYMFAIVAALGALTILLVPKLNDRRLP